MPEHAADEETDSNTDQSAEHPKENGSDRELEQQCIDGDRSARGDAGRLNWKRHRQRKGRSFAVRRENRKKHINFRKHDAGDAKRFREVAAHRGSKPNSESLSRTPDAR